MTHIVQWNLRGIKDKRNANFNTKVEIVSHMLSEPLKNLIVCLQETHVDDETQIPHEWNKFSHVFTMFPNFATATDTFSGSLLFINKSLEIISSEIIIPGRVILVKTKSEGTFNFTNYISIYGKASGLNSDKKAIIEAILHKDFDDNEDHIFIGDYNFVTSLLDRNTNNFNSVDVACKTLWHEVEVKLNLVDSFRITNKVRRLYTFASPTHSKSRIDRIYVPISLSGKIISTIFENTDVSDHKIVRTMFKHPVKRGPGNYIINTSLLDDPVYVNQVKEICRDFNSSIECFPDNRVLWDFVKMATADFSKNYSMVKSKERKLLYNRAISRIEILESIPKESLTNVHMSELNQNKKIEIDFLNYKRAGAILRAKIANFDENEVSLSYIARLEKLRGDSNTITSLTDDDGNIKEGTENVINVVNNFYSALYKREIEDVPEQNYFFRNITNRLSIEEKNLIDSPLTKEELYESLKDLKNEKSPGEDSISKEVLLFFWDDLSDMYLRCILEIKERKQLSESQKCALITLVYKKWGRNFIKHYRPISLLNVDLKVITRTLAKRMVGVMDKLISKNQTCLPGRHIGTNLHILQDFIDYANSKELEAAVLFLDQEKAFDRMSHSFILKTLRHFGFGDEFIDWIKIIYTDCSARVKINGYLSSSISIERGVRQGCPLSALLYVLCIEVLSLEFQGNPGIIGFKYHTDEHKDSGYADDVSIIFTDNASIDEIFNVLSKFEKATNAKINVDKTDGLWVGNWKHRLDTPRDIKWVNTMVKNLGVFVGNNRQDCEIRSFEEAKEKIKNKLSYWNGKGISLKGRIRVINTFILPKIWYICELHNMPTFIKSEIKLMLSSFIWGVNFHQRSIQGLEADYNEGGLRLVNIDKRINAIRVKWLSYLIKSDISYIEYYLANEIISDNCSKMGFDLLKGYSPNYINTIKNKFYKHAISAWKKLKVTFSPSSPLSIQNMWIYENILLQNDDGRVYKPPANSSFLRRRRDMPYLFRDLPFPIINRHRVDADFIRNINISFSNIQWTDEDYFYILDDDDRIDIRKLLFKDFYWFQMKSDLPPQPFKNRWGSVLPNIVFDWNFIWGNVHSNMLPYKTQSSLWMMTNLNFISAFTLNRMYNTPNVCCKCGDAEEGYAHCFLFCSIPNLVYMHFNTMLRQLVDIDMDLYEKAFGLSLGYPNNNGKKLRNYIVSCLKCVIFRNRAKYCNGNIETKTRIIIEKCKKYITSDLEIKFLNYKAKRKLDKFCELFLIDDILGSLVTNNTMISLTCNI